MRFRQVHLDFHTSGLIPGIGERFDAKAFAKTFKDANVDSVTVFSKCHHGLSYHPTKIGKMHPHLKFNLLREQIDALHAEGIRAELYMTATWDELAAAEHPEWRTVLPDNSLPMYMANEGNGVGWAYLDLSTPYLDYLIAQTEEMLDMFPDGDGIFMDISFQLPSISAIAKAKMEAAGLDWTNPADRDIHTERSVENYFTRMRDAVSRKNPDISLFFNSGHVRRGIPQHYRQFYDHLELESLPTAGWGYEHFPLSARYVDPLGIPFLGMTGKFHTHWGEVGGFKHPDSLIYEVGAMLAQGARCSIGDHMHPSGALEASTYKLIGSAFKYVADREAWAEETRNRADIALLSAEAAHGVRLVGMPGPHNGADEGATRVLLEGQFTFDILDTQADFAPYRLLILPDNIPVGPELKAKIEAYLAGGGRVLATGKSGIDPAAGFVFDVGAKWLGTSPNSGGDYVLPNPDLRASFVDEPLFMYAPAEKIRLTDGQSLGQVFEPYFDRTPRHFMGHLNAAAKLDANAEVAGVQKGGITYFAFPIFTSYMEGGAVAMLEIAERLIDFALGGDRIVTTDLPRAGRVTVRNQPRADRDVLHLMYATPALRGAFRGNPVQPIQDLITLTDIAVDVRPSRPVKAVRLVPGGENLDFTTDGNRVRFTVPKLRGHQMVEVAY